MCEQTYGERDKAFVFQFSCLYFLVAHVISDKSRIVKHLHAQDKKKNPDEKNLNNMTQIFRFDKSVLAENVKVKGKKGNFTILEVLVI